MSSVSSWYETPVAYSARSRTSWNGDHCRRPACEQKRIDDRDVSFEECFLEWYEAEKAVLHVLIAERAIGVGNGRPADAVYRPGDIRRSVVGREEDPCELLKILDGRLGRYRQRKPMLGSP